MPIDSALKRRSAGGVPFHVLGPGVTPDATAPVAWRVSSGWSYAGISPSPPVTPSALRDKFTLGTKESLGVTGMPTVGGWWGY